MTDQLSPAQAADRLRTDHGLLLAAVDGLSGDALAADYATAAGPLGDFCSSLHDLVAHVLMWNEINLAVLTEAGRGREHWSLAPTFETPETGRALNRAGVAAGRSLAADLLLDRLASTHAALLDQLAGYADGDWPAALATRVFTVPGQPPFWHAAVHLRAVPAGTR
ncbi:maleylpyruvate isomerase N-terminal domain-containing protein [Asanoa sp. NPDC049518]|uniref:maleylpyruvate isomerase N-terminal domain-containing protein n=1 Tax=unclassified Asanoa TaxID=2685164 RepID=UPI0034316EDC